jgi:hypothetical protein
MSSHIPTGSIFAVSALTGLIAIVQAVTSPQSSVSAIGQTPRALTTSAVKSTEDAGRTLMSQVQLAVLLEGFDWQVPLATTRPESAQ